MTLTGPAIGRRGLFALAGAASTVSLAACGSKSTTDTVATDLAKLPSYTPITEGPQPTLPGDEIVQPMFETAPQVADTFQSVEDSMLPKLSDPVSAFVISYDPPPPADNPFMKEANTRMGTDLQVQIVPADSYMQKFATTVAGNDVPDLVQFLSFSLPAGYPKLLESQFTDLSKLVAGDEINKYPNLANIPSIAWNRSRINGKIFGIPLHRPPFGSAMISRPDIIKQVTGEDSAPQSQEDFDALLAAINDPGAGRYALCGHTANDNVAWGFEFFGPMFGVPNEWKRDGDKLTSKFETDEYIHMVDYVKKLWEGGFYHPDTPSLAQAQAKAYMNNGTVLLHVDGIASVLTTAVPAEVVFDALVPFAAEGGKGGNYQGLSQFSFTALKKTDESKAKEYLKLLNYLAAPFGSKEAYFLQYGKEGEQHTLDENGLPVLTDAGKAQISPASLNRIGQGPQVLTSAVPLGERLPRAHAWQEATKDMLVENPVAFLYSPTAVKTASVGSALMSTITEYILGRSSLDDLKGKIQEWKTSSGDAQREEYTKQLDS